MEQQTYVVEREGAERPPLPAQPTPVAVSPLDMPAEQFSAGLDRRRRNRAALMQWVRESLVDGVDYGRIHVVSRHKCQLGTRCRNPAHFSKPSLFKPGAEKICGMLGVTVHYPTLHDYEQAALTGVQLAHVIIRCEIRDGSGHVVADGVGARSLKQDYGDINKSLKMAEKSAHIDATLRMAGLSEVFTQDLEDMNHGQNMEKAPANPQPHPAQAGTPKTPDPVEGQAAPQAARRISAAQCRRLEARISEYRLPRERVKHWLEKASHGRIRHFADLTPELYQRLDERLPAWAAKAGAQ